MRAKELAMGLAPGVGGRQPALLLGLAACQWERAAQDSRLAKILRKPWPWHGSHTHNILGSHGSGVIRLLFLCNSKCVRGITAQGIKKRLNIFILKLKEPMQPHTHTHARQLIGGSGTETAVIWDKSQDCLSVLQFRASAYAGAGLEVAVSLRSSPLPEPKLGLGSPQLSQSFALSAVLARCMGKRSGFDQTLAAFKTWEDIAKGAHF